MTTNAAEKFNWQDSIRQTYEDVINSLISYAPEIIGAIGLLIIGWLLACLMRFFTKKVVHGFDSIFKKISKQNRVRSEQLKNSYTTIISQVVFWAVFLFFIAAGTNLLGWKMFSGWLDGIIVFLPRVITGLLIILAGYLLSVAARSAILTVGSNEKIDQAPTLARVTQLTVFFCAIVIGVEQIGLQMHFLTTALIVVIGVLLAGACLAFGLGAKSMVANTIGAQYLRKHCQVGETLTIDGIRGEILEVRQTCIILETKEGRAIIPAKLFHDQVSLLSSMSSEITDTDNKKESGK